MGIYNIKHPAPSIFTNSLQSLWINTDGMKAINVNQQHIFVISKEEVENVISDEIQSVLSNSLQDETGTKRLDDIPVQEVSLSQNHLDAPIELLSKIEIKHYRNERTIECWKISTKLSFSNAEESFYSSIYDEKIELKNIKVFRKERYIQGELSSKLVPKGILVQIPFKWTEKVSSTNLFKHRLSDWNITLNSRYYEPVFLIQGSLSWERRQIRPYYLFKPYNHSRVIESGSAKIHNPIKYRSTQKELAKKQTSENSEFKEIESRNRKSEHFLPSPITQFHEQESISICSILSYLPPEYQISSIFSNGKQIKVTGFVGFNSEAGEVLFQTEEQDLIPIDCGTIDGMSFGYKEHIEESIEGAPTQDKGEQFDNENHDDYPENHPEHPGELNRDVDCNEDDKKSYDESCESEHEDTNETQEKPTRKGPSLTDLLDKILIPPIERQNKNKRDNKNQGSKEATITQEQTVSRTLSFSQAYNLLNLNPYFTLGDQIEVFSGATLISRGAFIFDYNGILVWADSEGFVRLNKSAFPTNIKRKL